MIALVHGLGSYLSIATLFGLLCLGAPLHAEGGFDTVVGKKKFPTVLVMVNETETEFCATYWARARGLIDDEAIKPSHRVYDIWARTVLAVLRNRNAFDEVRAECDDSKYLLNIAASVIFRGSARDTAVNFLIGAVTLGLVQAKHSDLAVFDVEVKKINSVIKKYHYEVLVENKSGVKAGADSMLQIAVNTMVDKLLVDIERDDVFEENINGASGIDRDSAM